MAGLKTLPNRVATLPSRLPVMQPGSWRAGNQSSTARGYGYKWQQARKGWLAKHPLCVVCDAQGRVTAATDVDHIVPHRGDMRLFWDSTTNWQSLCGPCHKAKTGAGE